MRRTNDECLKAEKLNVSFSEGTFNLCSFIFYRSERSYTHRLPASSRGWKCLLFNLLKRVIATLSAFNDSGFISFRSSPKLNLNLLLVVIIAYALMTFIYLKFHEPSLNNDFFKVS